MDNTHEKIYESATQKLLRDIDAMGLDQLARMRAKNFILLFRDSFKLDSVKSATFMPTIGDMYKLFRYDSDGFCRASSAAFVALMNSPEWQLMYIDEIWTFGPHFYVMHMPSKSVLDLTYDQYTVTGLSIPYELGRRAPIEREEKLSMTRFLNATGLDFTVALNNVSSKE